MSPKKTKKVSETKEDYLRAISLLEGGEKNPVNVTELAKHLGLAKSTVSERIRELQNNRLIKHTKYSKLEFTRKGRSIAEKLTYKHRIIEVFLHNVLKINKKKVHDEAHKLEHAFSDESIEKLSDFLGNPKKDPHGKPIKKN